MQANNSKGVCLIIGAGDGLGGAIAKAFARDGHPVCITRRARNLDQLEALVGEIRAQGGIAHAFGVDARTEADMIALFDDIEARIGPLEVVVFNIGANVRFGLVETTARVFTKVWEMACFAGFLAGREAARVMGPRGRGSILFTGATASLRGREGFAAFAAAKAGLRAIAQSAARELAPKGIHVAHVVVDGAIDGVFTRSNRTDVETLLSDDRILKPDQIAANYVWLHGHTSWTCDPGQSTGERPPMSNTIDFIFDFGSPNAYLAWKVLPGIAARSNAQVNLIPCLLGGLFKLTGNQAPMTAFGNVKGKLEYERLETQRFITKHGLRDFRFNPHFPVNTLLIMRGWLAARRANVGEVYFDAILKAMWEDGQKMDDAAVVAAVLRAAGLDAKALLETAQDPDVKAELAASTSAAAARGAFGIPTFFVGDEMFFGKDRLGQVEEALR